MYAVHVQNSNSGGNDQCDNEQSCSRSTDEIIAKMYDVSTAQVFVRYKTKIPQVKTGLIYSKVKVLKVAVRQ